MHSLCKFERVHAGLYIQNALLSEKQKKQHIDLSPLKLWGQFVLSWQRLRACLLGNSYGFSLKFVPFHITFVLCCCSKAENMPNGVLITHIPALAGLASGGSSKSTQATKHFYTMFSSRNTKGLLFTCQHDYAVQCFLLNVDQWSYFPTWSCGKSWDVGQRSPTILPGLPHAFGPWSG